MDKVMFALAWVEIIAGGLNDTGSPLVIAVIRPKSVESHDTFSLTDLKIFRQQSKEICA
jgi:hypothetical protein